MKPGNILFDVFTHPDGKRAVGFGQTATGRRLVVEPSSTEGGAYRCTEVKPLRLASLLSEKLRSGYLASRQPMYFDSVGGKFTFTHPEVSWGGHEWVLAAEPPAMSDGLEVVAATMRQQPAVLISQVEVDAWVHRQQQNETFLVAFTDLPVWSLVLAQTALANGWILRANPVMKGDTPQHLPSTNPVVWDRWLSQVFNEGEVRAARVHLGYSIVGAISKTPEDLVQTENWSSLI